MPISGQAPLSTIEIAKEQKITYESLLLCELFFPNAPSGSNTLYRLSRTDVEARS
jgi:hypothetical protein